MIKVITHQWFGCWHCILTQIRVNWQRADSLPHRAHRLNSQECKVIRQNQYRISLDVWFGSPHQRQSDNSENNRQLTATKYFKFTKMLKKCTNTINCSWTGTRSLQQTVNWLDTILMAWSGPVWHTSTPWPPAKHIATSFMRELQKIYLILSIRSATTLQQFPYRHLFFSTSSADNTAVCLITQLTHTNTTRQDRFLRLQGPQHSSGTAAFHAASAVRTAYALYLM